jgi:hypothetical protein
VIRGLAILFDHGWHGLHGWKSADDTLPLEADVLEIEQQGQLEARDVQIPEHLCEMDVGEGRHDLGIRDDGFINDQIGLERAYELPVIVDRKLPLLLDSVAVFS